MPKKIDHKKARAELAKLTPETLKAVTLRLPAALLGEVHRWAQLNRQDLTASLRELITLGLEKTSDATLATIDRKNVKRWSKQVVEALKAGRSPFEPFLNAESADVECLPIILAAVDYQSMFRRLMEKRENDEPVEHRVWRQKKADAAPFVQPLMDALDHLEQRFLARRKLFHAEGPDGYISSVHWFLSDEAMDLVQGSSDDVDTVAVRNLIAARYLVAENPDEPWNFAWDY